MKLIQSVNVMKVGETRAERPRSEAETEEGLAGALARALASRAKTLQGGWFKDGHFGVNSYIY